MKTREQILEYQRNYYSKHGEKQRAVMREYRRKRSQEWKLADGQQQGDASKAAIMTYNQVAELMGCSAEYVRQLERSAFFKLRKIPSLKLHWNEFKMCA